MQASAGFVSASALGMACGPALAGLLQMNFKIYNITFNANTLPGWVMAIAWLLYLVWLSLSFREPNRDTEDHKQEASNTGIVGSDALEKGVARPLLLSSDEEHQDEDLDQECEASEEAPKESRQAANSFGSAYRLLTPSVKFNGKKVYTQADIDVVRDEWAMRITTLIKP